MLHLNNLWRLDGRAVQDPGWVEAESGRDPRQGEADEDGIAQLPVLGVDTHFGALKH